MCALNVSLSHPPILNYVACPLQLYKEAGVPSTGFTGVPVFQAQGLTVKTERSRYTPLFLAKEDLDVAVGAAFSQREAAREATTHNKAAAAEEELAAAKAAVCDMLHDRIVFLKENYLALNICSLDRHLSSDIVCFS